MVFSCLKCNASFKKNQDLDRHLGRKFPCLSPEEKAKKNDCPGCDKTLYDQSTLIKHKSTCKDYKDYLETKRQEELRLLREENIRICEELNNLREELNNSRINNISEINGTVNIGNNNDNSVNTNITNNNRFELNSFYGDTVKKITTPDFIKMLDGILNDENNLYDILELLIKKIHFDVNNPSYHNIYSTNIRDKITHIYDDDAWVIGDESDFNMVAYSMIEYVKDFNECYIEIIKEHPELKSVNIEENIKNFNINRKNYRNLDMAVLQFINKYKNIPIATRKRAGM
jgi:hypothetical protein